MITERLTREPPASRALAPELGSPAKRPNSRHQRRRRRSGVGLRLASVCPCGNPLNEPDSVRIHEVLCHNRPVDRPVEMVIRSCRTRSPRALVRVRAPTAADGFPMRKARLRKAPLQVERRHRRDTAQQPGVAHLREKRRWPSLGSVHERGGEPQRVQPHPDAHGTGRRHRCDAEAGFGPKAPPVRMMGPLEMLWKRPV